MSEWKSQKPIYIFCPSCGDKAWISESHEFHSENSNVDSVNIGGVHVIKDFVDQHEEQQLVQMIDTRKPWVPSQEGRRKQDYGPKVSFLKKKVAVGNFGGFPCFAVSLFERMSNEHPELLLDFVPVEFCLLEYTPERGSYIRPHYDDMWIWGDRLITVNLLSDTALRLTREFKIPPYEIIIKMPARSLIVIRGEARYDWHHSINRYDIKSRRIAMTWREFSDEIIKDEEHRDFVTEVFQLANQVDEASA
uniref:Putative alpha-ketoglutarate-dependent dioxygenase ABH4 n=1 Tax=Aceria tosichella TaxID=561515 RepID=A0A6G1SGJ1_9ACAR